jgi:hypothetical protein
MQTSSIFFMSIMKKYQEVGLEKGCKEPGCTHDSPEELNISSFS